MQSSHYYQTVLLCLPIVAFVMNFVMKLSTRAMIGLRKILNTIITKVFSITSLALDRGQLDIISQRSSLPCVGYGLIISGFKRKNSSATKTYGNVLISLNLDIYSGDAEAVLWRCSVGNVFLEISQNSQENTYVRVSF